MSELAMMCVLSSSVVHADTGGSQDKFLDGSQEEENSSEF